MIETLHILIALGATITLLLVWNIVLEVRLRRLTRGSSGDNLERHIGTITKEYEALGAFKEAVQDKLQNLDERVQGSISGVGMVRFNPFAGSGSSKPSFAAAFLTESGSGLVISTLHARDSVSIFTKDISSFTSEQELTEEEQQALEKAKESLHT